MSEVINLLPSEVIEVLLKNKIMNEWVELSSLSPFGININMLLQLEEVNAVLIKDFHKAPKVTLTAKGYNAMK